MKTLRPAILAVSCLALASPGPAAPKKRPPPPAKPAPISWYVGKDTAAATVLTSRAALAKYEASIVGKEPPAAPNDLKAQRRQFATRLMLDFPVEWDWMMQDLGEDLSPLLAARPGADVERKMIDRVAGELGPAGKEIRSAAAIADAGPDQPACLELYFRACRARRAKRLAAGKTDLTCRNVALNPFDVREKPVVYPHASSNSEYGEKAPFLALNCIDGETANVGHGARFPSWGPDKRTDLWWKVEFGRPVTIDKICLWIRAHFPHDRHWHSAAVEFSDGTSLPVTIEKTERMQPFTFKPRTVTWLRFTKLVQDEPMGWCGFCEVQVWGRPAIDSPKAKP